MNMNYGVLFSIEHIKTWDHPPPPVAGGRDGPEVTRAEERQSYPYPSPAAALRRVFPAPRLGNTVKPIKASTCGRADPKGVKAGELAPLLLIAVRG